MSSLVKEMALSRSGITFHGMGTVTLDRENAYLRQRQEPACRGGGDVTTSTSRTMPNDDPPPRWPSPPPTTTTPPPATTMTMMMTTRGKKEEEEKREGTKTSRCGGRDHDHKDEGRLRSNSNE